MSYEKRCRTGFVEMHETKRNEQKLRGRKNVGCIAGILGQNHRMCEVGESLENLCSDYVYPRLLLYGT